MPRDRKGLGRTGSKHKQTCKVKTQQPIKGVDDVFQSPQPPVLNLVKHSKETKQSDGVLIGPLCALAGLNPSTDPPGGIAAAATPAMAQRPASLESTEPPPSVSPPAPPASASSTIDRSNDACSCGASRAGYDVEHDMVCPIWKCFAWEVGCCDGRMATSHHLYREVSMCDWQCQCIETALDPGWNDEPRERFMPAHASTTFGGWRVPRRRWLGRRLEDQRCSCWLGCGSVGRYFGCPLGINGATGKRRGDEIAQIRGHKIYMGEGGQEVFGEELPSPPESPLADHDAVNGTQTCFKHANLQT